MEEKPKNEEYEEESDKRGLVKQLLKITKEQQKEELRSKVPQKPPQSELTTKKSTRLSEAEINFERGGSVRLRESPVVSQLKTSATPGNFARSDGGRFSMKSVGPTRPTSNQPGSRASLAGPAVSAKNHPAPAHKPKENPELAAWLRRKGYNPLKAAAEGHKKKMSLPKESLTDISCAEESPQYLSK